MTIQIRHSITDISRFHSKPYRMPLPTFGHAHVPSGAAGLTRQELRRIIAEMID